MLGREAAVKSELSRFLSRKSTPRGWTDDMCVEELDVLCGIALSMLSRDVGQAMDALKTALRRYEERATHRGWPTGGELRKALEERKQAAPIQSEGASEASIERAAEWWGKFGDLPGWWNTREIVEALIKRGIPAHDLWRAGVDVPRHLRDWRAAADQKGSAAHARYQHMEAAE